MTANASKKYLQNYKMCETIDEDHAREKLIALDFQRKTFFHASTSGENSEHIFYLKTLHRLLRTS